MAAPSAAIVPVAQIAQSAVKVLSTDIVKLEGKFYRRIRLKEPRTSKDGSLLLTKTGRIRMRTVTRMEPIDVAASVNPIGLGILGILGAATAFALFGRVGGAVLGIGEFEIYKGPLADEFDAWKGRRALDAATKDARAECRARGSGWVWHEETQTCVRISG